MRRLFVLAIFAAVFTTVSSAAAPLDMKLELVPAVALPGIPVGLHVTFERAEAKCRRSVRRSTSTSAAIESPQMSEPANPPMGRLDAFDVGPKKLTVQTEFFTRPSWRVETKVYLGGALKKVYAEDIGAEREAELQKLVNEFHQAKIDEIMEGLRARKQQ